MVSFDIIFEFAPQELTYTTIFFIDGDNIFSTDINTYTLSKLADKVSGLQSLLRKRYDYHRDLFRKIDDVEIKALYSHFKSINDNDNMIKISVVIRNRKIDNILN